MPIKYQMTFRDDAVSYNANPFFDFVPFTKRRGAYQQP